MANIDYIKYQFTGNDMNVNFTDVTKNYVYLRIYYVNESRAYVLLDTIRKKAEDNAVSFEISEYLKFNNTVNVDIHSSELMKLQGELTAYKLEYAYTDTTTEIPAYSSTTQEHCFQGGLSDDFTKYLEVLGLTWYDFFIVDQKKFLTWQPTTKTLEKTSKELLFWLVTAANFDTIKLTVSLFKDGVETISIIDTYLPSRENEIIQLKVDPTSLGITDFDYYQVYLLNELDDIISEKRTYYVDESDFSNKTKFIFNNSLSVFDSVTFTGNIIEEESFERTIQFKNNKRSQFYVDKDDKIDANSGYLSRIWHNSKDGRYYLSELLFGRQSYTYDDIIMSEIIILNDNINRNNNLQNIRSLSIQYIPAKKKSFLQI